MLSTRPRIEPEDDMKKEKAKVVIDETESELLSKIWNEIESYDSLTRSFRSEGKRIYNLYINNNSLDYTSIDWSSNFDVVWSNTQLLQPIIFSTMPEPYVERRFKDKDPQGRRASLILERVLKSVLSLQDTVGTFKQSVYDYLLPGRGQVWPRYAPVFQMVPQVDPMTGEPLVDEDGKPVLVEELKYENVEIDYVPWQDFGYSMSKTWPGVKSAWRHFYLTKYDAKKQLGEDAARKLKYTYGGTTDEKRADEQSSMLHKKAKITEFWDCDSEMVYWISEATKDTIIKQAKDPLGLSKFLPCPKPLFATKKTDNLIPVSDYTILKALVDELNIVSSRESGLVDAMKASGVSSAQAAAALQAVFDSDDNIIQPIKEWLTLKQQGGTNGGAIEWLPLDMFAKVLEQLRVRKQELKADIYELQGISDVQRGVTNPYESGKAVEAKAQASSERINEKRRLVQEFISDTLNIVAEIISEHFADETIFQMAGVDMLGEEFIVNFPSDVALLRDDVTRHFRIDVTIDSLVQADEEKEKASVNEFINAMAQIMGQSQVILQVMPDMKPLVLESLKFAVRRYKAGRQLEGLLDTSIDNALAAEEAAKMQPPPEDPSIALAQYEADTKRMKEETKAQLEQVRTQHKMQMDQLEMQHKTQLDIAKLNQEQAKFEQEKAKFSLEQYKAQAKTQLDAANAAADQKELQLKDKVASSQIALDTANLKLEQERLKYENQMAILKIRTETATAQTQMALQARTESDKMVVQERSARQQTEQKVSKKETEAKGSSDMAGVANAIASALKSIPQPVINVEAPKPTKRVGTIEKKGGKTKVVVEEVEEEGEDDSEGEGD